MLITCQHLISRELQLAGRRKAELINPLVFFSLVIALFPLGITPELKKLTELAVGALWVAALLASLLSLDLLFHHDYEDGTLEQLLLAAAPAQLLVLCKTCCHWLVTGLPLTLLSPLLALTMALPAKGIPLLMLTLALGTFTFSLLGSVGAALTVGLRKGGLVLTILIMPLFVPVIIFSTSAVQALLEAAAWRSQLALLAALCLTMLAISPWLTVTALRISLSD